MSLLDFSSSCSKKETGDKWCRSFCKLDALPDTQLTESKQWRELKHWPHLGKSPTGLILAWSCSCLLSERCRNLNKYWCDLSWVSLPSCFSWITPDESRPTKVHKRTTFLGCWSWIFTVVMLFCQPTNSAFSYSSPATWNSSPISIKNRSSLYSFKRHLKSYFIAQLTNNKYTPSGHLSTACASDSCLMLDYMCAL